LEEGVAGMEEGRRGAREAESRKANFREQISEGVG
jgi:hypothetical protein